MSQTLLEKIMTKDFSLDAVEQILEGACQKSLLYKFADAYVRVYLDTTSNWLKIKHLQRIYDDKETMKMMGDTENSTQMNLKETSIDALLAKVIQTAAFRTIDNEAHREFFDLYLPVLEERIQHPENLSEEQQTVIIKLIMVARTDEFTSLMLDKIVEGSEQYGNRVYS